VRIHLVVEAIGGEVTEESKVRNNCDNYDVSIIMNVKGRLGGGSTNMPSKITVSQGTFSVLFAEPPCSLTPLLIYMFVK